MTYKNRPREIHMWWRKHWLSRPKLARGAEGLRSSHLLLRLLFSYFLITLCVNIAYRWSRFSPNMWCNVFLCSRVQGRASAVGNSSSLPDASSPSQDWPYLILLVWERGEELQMEDYALVHHIGNLLRSLVSVIESIYICGSKWNWHSLPFDSCFKYRAHHVVILSHYMLRHMQNFKILLFFSAHSERFV